MSALTKLLFALLLINNSWSAELTGVADYVSDREFNFRTADENITIRLPRAPLFGVDPYAELKSKLKENSENPKIDTFTVEDARIVARERVPFGTRGDCSELPLGVDDLIKSVEDGGESMTLQGFLDSIPDGTLESFTFATNTRSLQRGEGDHIVDEEWPRVIRSSMDGKVTISFVCHPDQEKHNSVEIIYFDDATQKFKTLSFDFNAPPGRGSGSAGEGKRIHEDPASCISCHGTSDKNGQPGSSHLKLNWPEYFFWGDCDTRRGITLYGMADDNMGRDARGRSYSYPGCDRRSDRRAHEQLRQSFESLKTKAQTNPCLASLPWAKAPERGQPRVGIERTWTDNDYLQYPYANDSKVRKTDGTGMNSEKYGNEVFNYSLLTNTRFTDTYGHLTARRNLQLFKDNPRYEEFKYYLAMESIPGCLSSRERDRVARELGVNLRDNPSSRDMRETPLTLAYGSQVVGFENHDWTMHPPSRLTPNSRSEGVDYNSVIVADTNADYSIHEVVLGELLKDVSRGTDFEEETKSIMARGVEDTFGSRFSCIDDLGQAVKVSNRGSLRRTKESVCESLKEAAANQVITRPRTPVEVSSECSNEESTQTKIDEEILDTIMNQQAKAGRELVDSCVGCHTGDHELGFITEDPTDKGATEIARLRQRARSTDFWQTVQGHLNGTIEPRMPFGCDGDDCMNRSQTDAILAYLRVLSSDAYEQLAPKEESETSCSSVSNRRTINLPGRSGPTTETEDPNSRSR